MLDAAQSVLESLAALPTNTPALQTVSPFAHGSGKRKAKMTLIIKLLMCMTIVSLFAGVFIVSGVVVGDVMSGREGGRQAGGIDELIMFTLTFMLMTMFS